MPPELHETDGVVAEWDGHSVVLDRSCRRAGMLPGEGSGTGERVAAFLAGASDQACNPRLQVDVLAEAMLESVDEEAIRRVVLAFAPRWKTTVVVHFPSPSDVDEAFVRRAASLVRGAAGRRAPWLILSGPFAVPDETTMEALFQERAEVRVAHGWWGGCAEPDYTRVHAEALRALGRYGLIAPADWYVHLLNAQAVSAAIASCLRSNYYSGFSVRLHMQHPSWTPAREAPPLPDAQTYVELLVGLYEAHPHYDALFAPLNEIALGCAEGNWDAANSVAGRLHFLFRGDGAIRCYRQVPFLARKLAPCEGLLGLLDEEVVRSLVAVCRDAFDWSKDAYCGKCQWRHVCGGVDFTDCRALQDAVCAYRKLFVEGFTLRRLQAGAIPIVPL